MRLHWMLLAFMSYSFWVAPAPAATLNQTIQFMGTTPETLYAAFLSAKEHGAMTADGTRPATFYRPGDGNVSQGEEGDELHAFGMKGPDGKMMYALTAKILKAVPGKCIVMSWKNFAWGFAINKDEMTDLESTVVLTFRRNAAGAEVQLVQANVPDYEVKIPDTGEVGPLSTIVNTHWNLLYWEPMKRYLQAKGAK